MAILTVKRGGGGGGSYGTIESALSAAAVGDVIELSPGRYEEVIVVSVAGITIRSVEKHKAIICSRKGEDSLSVITVEACEAVLVDLDIRGPGGTKKQSTQDSTPAVLILAPDVELIGCKVTGKGSIGIKTYETNTRITTCHVDVGKTAVLAMEQDSGVRIDRCRLRSAQDTGIWLLAASRSEIIETVVSKCGHTGIWFDSAPAFLKDVTVTEIKNDGIVFDWPESTPISDSDYTALSRVGHCLQNVSVTKCKKNGVSVYPGVRVVCAECTFSNNGDAGAFFQGSEDEDEEREEAHRKRIKGCDTSVIHEGTVESNNGFGVEAEESGLVKLSGHIDFGRNKKGDGNSSVISPAKRARSAGLSTSSVNRTGSAKQPALATPKKSSTGKQSAVDPFTKVTEKSGVALPKNWPTGLIFLGDFNVGAIPSIDKLQEFYLTHPVKVNKKVSIADSPEDRGLGLFAAQTLRKGQVVGFYSGHLRRQQVEHDSEYVANWRPIGEKEDGKWEIDAEWCGNEMRFANYPNNDEEPNMKANCIRRNNLQVIAFKAIADIKKGTELLWDYGPDYFSGNEDG